jgi:hypothetical protein
MKQVLLWAAGRAMSSTLGFAIIKAYAFRTPHHHLKDLDGSDYMNRWRIVDEGTIGGRILEALTGYSSIRLHHICRPDQDRDLHNHPFEYRTFILRGHYSEVYQEPNTINGEMTEQGHRWVHTGGTATGGPGKRHRIDLVSNGGVWTFFMMSRNTERWGFFVNNKFVESTRYFIRRGYSRETIRAVSQGSR